MRVEENERYGKTVILTAEDDLNRVPRSHQYLITDPIREIFPDPVGYFGKAARRCPFAQMARWLKALVAAGRWELHLNRGPGRDRYFALAGFDWQPDLVRGAIIGPPSGGDFRNYPQQLRRYYSLVDFVNWCGFGCLGGLDGAGTHLPLTAFAFDYHGADVDLRRTFVWGWSPGGDMLIYTTDGRGGWLDHGTHEIRLLGTIADTIDWVYSELVARRCPDPDHKCETGGATMSKWGLIDLTGRQVLPCEYESLDEPVCGLLVHRKAKGDKDGYINVKGQVVIPAKFHNAFPFDRATGLAVVMETRNGVDNYGLIDRAGNLVLKAEYAGIRNPREGLIQIASHAHHGLYGYADLSGKVVLTPRYKYGTVFSCGLALVTYPDDLERSFFIDRTGRKVLGPYGCDAYETYAFNPDGIAMVWDAGKKGDDGHYYINPVGQVLLRSSPKRPIGEFHDGLARAYDEKLKKFGFVDISGEWAIQPKYDATLGFIRGYACVGVGGVQKWDADEVKVVGRKWGLIDPQGREVVPIKYDGSGYVGEPSCGRIRFGEPEGEPIRFGYRSTLTGKVVIPAKFSYAGTFSEGFAVVEEEEKKK